MADFLVIILFVVTLLIFGFQLDDYSSLFKSFWLFIFYTFIINIAWATILQDIYVLKTLLFYAFNGTLIYIVFICCQQDRKRGFKFILAGTVISVLLQIGLSISGLSASEGRQTFFFNNPNQLGYWALLSATIFCVCTRCLKIRLYLQLVFLIFCTYLVAVSLSKGAIISFFLLLVLHYSRKIGHVFVGLITVILIFVVFSDLDIYHNMETRLQNIGQQSDDNITGRGYDLIWTYPQYLLLGAGEKRGLGELHSTWGTVIFSYGAIGTTLFLMALWRLFRMAGFGLILYLLPAFAYGTTHQGLRFSLLWVLFAVIGAAGLSGQRTPAQEERKIGGISFHGTTARTARHSEARGRRAERARVLASRRPRT